jgi:hypothetical protein
MPDPNRFQQGPFALVEKEMGLDDPAYRFREGHWFLSPGMVHGVRLREGKAE